MDVTFRIQGQTFVWDSRKARTNVNKHKVKFEKACEVFFDPFVMLLDASVQRSTREAALGLTEDWTLLYVVHMEWERDAIRVISARQATAAERTHYENG